jgi:hypothetical protein
MSKRKNDPVLDDYLKLRDEMLIEKVDEIFRTQSDNYVSAMEEIGFEWHEEEDFEKQEEDAAKLENPNQKLLVDYFKGKEKLSDGILEIYLSECNAEHPNYALVRKYFKKANLNLKALLLFGLNQRPTSIDLLSDLAYFHEYENVLRELIARYTVACKKEDDLSKFSEVAQDFYYATNPDGYDALHALRELFSSNTQKRESIELLIAEHKDSEMEDRVVRF